MSSRRQTAPAIWAITYDTSGDCAFIGNVDGAVVQRDLRTGDVMQIGQHASRVWGIARSLDGQAITAAADGTLRLWSPQGGAQVLRGHSGAVTGVACHPQEAQAVSVGSDGTVRFWELETGRCLRALGAHRRPALGVAFSPSGGHVASTYVDGSIGLWNFGTSEGDAILLGHIGRVWKAAFSLDGRHLLSAGADGTVRLWEVSAARCVRVLDQAPPPPFSFSYCVPGVRDVAYVDERHALVAVLDGTLQLWDVVSGQCVARVQAHADCTLGVAVRSNGGRALSSSINGEAREWDLSHMGIRPVSRLAPRAAAIGSQKDGSLASSRTPTS